MAAFVTKNIKEASADGETPYKRGRFRRVKRSIK